MPPTNSATSSASTTSKIKRQKISHATGRNDERVRRNVDAAGVMAQNAVQSPLLRLPAELRSTIWNIVYGNMMVVIHSNNQKSGHKPSFRLKFDTHENVITEHFLTDAPVSAPKLVCRQFWAETSEVFLKSCTVRTASRKAFRVLALSEQPIVQRVQKLIIAYARTWPSDFPRSWANYLTSSLVGRFKNLRGVEMYLWVVHGYQLRRTDVLNDDLWKSNKLPAIIRSFQQHKLEPALTSVNYLPYRWVHETAWNASTVINEAIRTELLKYRPRRTSKRGKVEDEDDD
ncbi:hypothetical protein M3J09_010994 [Ascochyta lentis]